MKRDGVVGQSHAAGDMVDKRQSASDMDHVEHQHKADATDVVANNDAKHHLRRRDVRDSADDAAKRCAQGHDCRRRDVAQQQHQLLFQQRRQVVSPLLQSHSSCFLLV